LLSVRQGSTTFIAAGVFADAISGKAKATAGHERGRLRIEDG
jgi:hypothetical protein